ncbi:spore coat protein U domain-containing protein [Salmonella enterica]|uniref:Spore coat protein U domain-containing protein n=1 Tax=Salmonella diarizonae TaxID=59204 RepID=A0A702DD04_SALDZ|nr:SCPU domain-containing protein [Salmonella enterica]ECC3214325.1 SCPU domain-containing protein [Salmonella enterica subsp. diarizonae]EHG3720517.1 spore coat protein U domain-containing protein [Salmonella enterica subsp. diarizonae serovar 11:k:z53]EKR1692419.1 spore coat protein U domain-containing protein [Salmonella enterica subsp. diarizonae serovar 6,7,14:k:z50]EAA9598986.1 SCPU domain-containing protein [Salmonella enterica]
MKPVICAHLIIYCMATAFIPTANAAVANGTFQVLITIQKACTVTAGSGSNISLGTVNSSATNTTGSNTISVTCSKTTPYFIGLAPSNSNTLGAGIMSSVANSATNTDKVPYQLNQTSPTGPIWGNTATTTTVGNGVAGTGSGAAQSITVYATAASANFTPDSYADTVTVNVNY